jgi:hypothetical protein
MDTNGTELRIIDFSKKHFDCDGRKFTLSDSLSFNRYRELQKINLELGFSATFQDIFKHIREAWDFLNSAKPAEAAVVLHNIMYGVVSLDDKYDPALRICALFINEEGEDVTTYDEGKMRDKIECWGKELDVLPFFQLALTLTPGFINAYQSIIPGGIKQEQENKSS